MQFIYEPIWFLLPAGFANMAPVFAAKVFPRWDFPVDARKTFRRIRIFGDHKTIRGLVAGVLLSAGVFLIQKKAYLSINWIRTISAFDYGKMPVSFGALTGFGALFGDLIKSFFKRRVGIDPGKSWFPFDQIDWILGCLAATSLAVRPSSTLVFSSILMALVLSLIVKWLGYLLRLEKNPI